MSLALVPIPPGFGVFPPEFCSLLMARSFEWVLLHGGLPTEQLNSLSVAVFNLVDHPQGCLLIRCELPDDCLNRGRVSANASLLVSVSGC